MSDSLYQDYNELNSYKQSRKKRIENNFRKEKVHKFNTFGEIICKRNLTKNDKEYIDANMSKINKSHLEMAEKSRNFQFIDYVLRDNYIDGYTPSKCYCEYIGLGKCYLCKVKVDEPIEKKYNNLFISPRIEWRHNDDGHLEQFNCDENRFY